jgi:hypothetical protein
MTRVLNQQAMLIWKHGLSFLETNPMLSNVLLVLSFVPLELKIIHIYSIFTLYLLVKGHSHMSNAGISCGRVRRPGGPARRVLRRRRDDTGRHLHAELYGIQSTVYASAIGCSQQQDHWS